MLILILTLLLPRMIAPGEIIYESHQAAYAYAGISNAGYSSDFKIYATDHRDRYIFYVPLDENGRGTLRTVDDKCFMMQNIGLEQQVFLTPCRG